LKENQKILNEIIVIYPEPENQSENKLEKDGQKSRLKQVLSYGLKNRNYRIISKPEELSAVLDEWKKIEKPRAEKGFLKLLFAVELDENGINTECTKWLGALRSEKLPLYGCVGGVVVDGKSELYTKNVGRDIVLSANLSGCSFPGRPFVEGTLSLCNFNVQAMNKNTDVLNAYCLEVEDLVERLSTFDVIKKEQPKLLVLHAGREAQSNTYSLWKFVKDKLVEKNIEVEEISIQNGSVQDCRACLYQTCLHFGEADSCFYGGVMVDKVYPALKNCDGLLLLCPNYNDALSANLMAVINRMTALYRKVPFFTKDLFAIIVSGYSGSDIVAQQLISSLNMNKAFRLPARFAVMEIANNRGEALKLEGIEKRMNAFATYMENVLKGTIEEKTELISRMENFDAY